MFYSASKNTWFDPVLRSDYEKIGLWPEDAKEYPPEVFEMTVSNRPINKIMVPGADGAPILTDPDPLPLSAIKSNFFEKVRTARETVLNRLAGIGLAAQISNDAVTVAKVITTRMALLNITSASEVNAATDEAELKSALLSEYQAIIAEAGEDLKNSFVDLLL